MRTTHSAVERILGSNWDGKTPLASFIDGASAVVDRVVDCAAKKGYPLNATEAELIERWLAAHMYAQMDMLYQSKSTGGANASFQGQTAMSLDSTRYGQTAVNLDFSGCLSAIGKRAFASGAWLGKPPSAQIPYKDRS